ncbi:TPA: hypothetical protein ACHOTI_004693, partial [Escherichia coli]
EKISRTGCVIGLARMTAGNYVKQAQLLFCMKLSSLKWNSKTKGASNENPLRRVFCCLFSVSMMHLVVLMWLADSVIQVAYCC